VAGTDLELPEALDGAAYVDNAVCVECHEDYDPGGTVHGDVPAFRTGGVTKTGCQSCHGPGSLHVDSSDPEDIVNPASSDAGLADNLCVRCHRIDGKDSFAASLHGMSDVTCVSCHRMHGDGRAPLLRDREPALCFGCHQDIRGAAYLPSHHPVREGGVSCSDCHDLHSGQLRTVQADGRTNDLCLSCHPGKEGPFIFEHDPVIEDCTICHDPHGAVANHLLTQNEPFLCLQCHQAHFHTTIPGIEGEFTSLDGYGGVSARDGSKRGFLTKCTQCHTEIHGSDLPSQSISGQGRALTR
jgi:DmsE family decaheme c-type cytochrome